MLKKKSEKLNNHFFMTEGIYLNLCISPFSLYLEYTVEYFLEF